MKLKDFDLVEIEWEDSLSDEGIWEKLEDYDWDDLHANILHRSAGYLIKEGKRTITISHSLRDNRMFILGVITIPKSCITKIRKL